MLATVTIARRWRMHSMTVDPSSNTAVEVSLQLASAADAGWLVAAMKDFNLGEGITLAEETLRPVLLALIADATLGRVWLIRFAGETVGYVVLTFGYDLEFAGRDAFITELYLRPPARGRGIGGVALARVEAAAIELGVRAIHLMVRPENRPAVALYASAGYTSPPRTLLSKVLVENARAPSFSTAAPTSRPTPAGQGDGHGKPNHDR